MRRGYGWTRWARGERVCEHCRFWVVCTHARDGIMGMRVRGQRSSLRHGAKMGVFRGCRSRCVSLASTLTLFLVSGASTFCAFFASSASHLVRWSMLSHGVVVGARRDTLSMVCSRRLLQRGMLQRAQGCHISQVKWWVMSVLKQGLLGLW